jgi:hypothetical protein
LSNTRQNSLQLEDGESELVAREAAAFAQALPEPAARARYDRLAVAVASGSVPDDLVGALETMLEILFDTGRVSNRAVLQSVFSRTPRGRVQSAGVRDLNRALESLRGQTLRDLRLSSAGPGRHSLSVETDGCRVVIEFARDGPTINNLEIG